MTRSRMLRHGWVGAALVAATALAARPGGRSAPQRPAPAGVCATPPAALPSTAVRAEPGDLRPVLHQALTRFASLQTYRYASSVRLYENGTLLHETRSRGCVKDQNLIVARTQVDGQVYDVIRRGDHTRVRKEGETGSNFDEGSIDELSVDPRSANFVDALNDPSLALRPVVAAEEESVGGIRCTSMKMTLLEDGGFVAMVTFAVDPDGQLRLWRMESEVSNNGRTVKTVAESTFDGFNEPWEIRIPEWSE